MAHIYQATEFGRIAILKRNPPIYLFEVHGMASTSGWTNVRLEPRVYVMPPEDGIWEFDLVGDQPTGMVLPMLTPVSAFGMMEWNKDLRGFRVYSATNSIEYEIYSSLAETIDDKAFFEATFEDDDDTVAQAAGVDKVLGFDASDVEFPPALELVETTAMASIAGRRCHAMKLMSIDGVPEVKTEWKTKCVLKIGGKCVTKTKIPQLFRRSTKMVLQAKVCWPGEDDIRNAVEDCAKQAVAAGVLAGVFTGSLSAAAAALKTYLVGCLKAKGIELAEQVSVDLDILKEKGPWKPV